jgi:5-methylcytosine-specific restriction endonuclease McrA
MVWQNGRPGSNIPARVKRIVRHRQANQCNTIDPNICTGEIQEFDHITNIATLGVERSQANDPDNIQGLCAPCHKVKTQREARAGQNRWKRKPERHPGLT